LPEKDAKEVMAMFTEKIIATIGPSSASYETLSRIIKEGASCIRINFSHGDENSWKNYIKLIREVEEDLGKIIAIMGDLSGPSVRIGALKEDIILKKGEEAFFVYKNNHEEGSKEIPLPIKKFFETVSEGDILLLDDGLIRLSVEEVIEDCVRFRALTDATIKSRKSVVILGKDLKLPPITERDMKALKSVVKNGEVDILGLSYVKSVSDIATIKDVLSELGIEGIKLASKIETKSAVSNLHDIIEHSDYIVVARGDLGMHFPLEDVPRLQSKIIRAALIHGKPVYVATQVLASMVERSVPTRSEIVDVVHAVYEGVDGFLVTGETAVGKNPDKVVKWLRKILECYRADVESLRSRILKERERLKIAVSLRDKFAEGIVTLSENLGAKLAVYTKTGGLARRISKYRPKEPFYAGSSDIRVLRQLAPLYGTMPVKVSLGDYSQGLKEMFERLKTLGEISYGEVVVLTYGLRDEPRHLVEILKVV